MGVQANEIVTFIVKKKGNWTHAVVSGINEHILNRAYDCCDCCNIVFIHIYRYARHSISVTYYRTQRPYSFHPSFVHVWVYLCSTWLPIVPRQEARFAHREVTCSFAQRPSMCIHNYWKVVSNQFLLRIQKMADFTANTNDSVRLLAKNRYKRRLLAVFLYEIASQSFVPTRRTPRNAKSNFNSFLSEKNFKNQIIMSITDCGTCCVFDLDCHPVPLAFISRYRRHCNHHYHHQHHCQYIARGESNSIQLCNFHSTWNSSVLLGKIRVGERVNCIALMQQYTSMFMISLGLITKHNMEEDIVIDCTLW